MLLIFVIFLSFALSYAAKILVDHFLTAPVHIIGSFVGFRYAENAGVAFSMHFGQLQTFLIIVALLLMVWASRYATTHIAKIAFGLIIGGALGNLADRLTDGVVTDFIQVGTFPIFNIADSCITIGVILLIAEWLVRRGREV